MTGVDPERSTFVIPAAVVELTAALLAEVGDRHFEASAVWVGCAVDDATVRVTRVCRPEQVAYATPHGLAVELTEQGLTDLIMSLAADEVVVARLHTHGTDDVDHSAVDDRNLVVAHPGAISIVVPWFAADGIELDRCGVHILTAGRRWRRLSVVETRARLIVK
jgi:hypothetical protein